MQVWCSGIRTGVSDCTQIPCDQVDYMHFIKHLIVLVKNFFQFAVKHKAWWIVPLVLFFLFISLLIVAGQVSAPFIYTLF